MTRTFADAGLTPPPIPTELRGSLRVLSDWCFGTRDVSPMGMYFFDEYIHEAFDLSTPDYVAVSHAGHGINSYFVTYQLVHRQIALFAQTPFGGVYADKAADARAMDSLFQRCAALIALAEREGGRSQREPGRLLVLESEMRDVSYCGWLPHGPSAQERPQWLEANRSRLPAATEEARNWFSGGDDSADRP